MSGAYPILLLEVGITVCGSLLGFQGATHCYQITDTYTSGVTPRNTFVFLGDLSHCDTFLVKRYNCAVNRETSQ